MVESEGFFCRVYALVRRVPRGRVVTYGKWRARWAHRARRGQWGGRYTPVPMCRGRASSTRAAKFSGVQPPARPNNAHACAQRECA